MWGKCFYTLLLIILCTISLFNCNDYSKNTIIPLDLDNIEDGITIESPELISVSLVEETVIGRNILSLCLAVGCTKTGRICEKSGGRMITNFRSINGTKQAYFRSILVNETHILSINCRVAHFPCCFEDPNKIEAIVNATSPQSPPAADAPSSTTSQPPSAPSKIYLLSNICLGLLGGAGHVDCNG